MVDDKSKEWKFTFAGGQSKFAEEAACSQSSSYKQKQVEKGVFSRTKRVYIDVQKNGELCRQSRNNDVGAATLRRLVRFIDEVLGLTPQELVISTVFRPPTTAEEKPLLYYTSEEYEFLALEDYIWVIMDMRFITKRRPDEEARCTR